MFFHRMTLMQRLANSWKLIKGSFQLIVEHPKLFIFPVLGILSFVGFLIVLILLLSPLLLIGAATEANIGGLFFVAILMLLFFGPFFGTFFAVGLSHEVGQVLSGKNVSIRRGIKHAFHNLGEVILWSLTLFLVNLIAAALRSQARKLGVAGRIVGDTLVDVLMAGWGFVTAFVIPIMVFEDTNPFHSIKRSVSLLKHTWGETLVGYIGAGSLLGLLVIPLFLLLFIPIIGLFFLPVFILGVVFVALLTQVFNTVFMTALYIYATKKDTKHAEKYFEKDLILHGFY